MAYLAKQYYRMSKDELQSSIRDMRGWLLKFGGHERWTFVLFALNVAVCAYEIADDRDNDPWLKEMLDIIC